MLKTLIAIGVTSALVLGFLLAMLLFNINIGGTSNENVNNNENSLRLNTTDQTINEIVINVINDNDVNVTKSKKC